MQIKLTSNLKFIVNLSLPFMIICGALIIVMVVLDIIGWAKISDSPYVFLEFICIEIVCTIIIIYVKHHKGPSFVFTESSIYEYQKDELINVIDVANIEYMHYYPYRLHYFITIIFGALMEGGAMKILIKERDGTTHELGFIGEKDAKRLKIELYPSILKLYYQRGYKS